MTTRKTAVVTGVIFIVATVAAIVAAALTPVLTKADILTQFSAHANQVSLGAIFYLLAAFTSVGIAIALYPVLKGLSASLALGAVVFRTLEAVFYIVAVVSSLSLLTLSKQLTSAGANRTVLQAIGNSLISVHDHATLVAVFAFCIGAFMYYFLFFKSQLVPRWLSGFGIIAISMMFLACVLSIFADKPITGYVPLVIPIALQEMVLAVWLIAKGFNPKAVAALESKK
jgi:hypothetical protein